MSDALVTQAQLEGLLRRLRLLEQRVGRSEVRESGQITGSFVPAWVGTGTAGTFTYGANQARVEWTLDGNRLLYHGRITITAITVAPTLNLTITGWPYPAVADSGIGFAGGGTFTSWAMNTAAGYTQLGLQFANGSSVANVVESGDNVAPANTQGGELIVGSVRFAGQYRVA